MTKEKTIFYVLIGIAAITIFLFILGKVILDAQEKIQQEKEWREEREKKHTQKKYSREYDLPYCILKNQLDKIRKGALYDRNEKGRNI